MKKTYLHLGFLVFAVTILVVFITLWTLAHFKSGLSQGLHIQLDSVNGLAWTVVPVLAVVLLKFFWSTLDSYYRTMAPYISLSQYPAPATLTTSYQTATMGWVTMKALFNKHYMLGIITSVSLLNEILVVGTGGMFLPLSAK